jgi:hypothetical protein
MTDADQDTLIRMAAFEHVRRLGEVYDHLTATELKPGFVFGGERIPLMNPQRGIFKPQQMRFLLSIKTVFPKPAARSGTTTSARCIARPLPATRLRLYGAGPGRYRQSVASRCVQQSGSNYLFPRHRARPLSGHAADLHLRVGRECLEGASGVRGARSRNPGTAKNRARTALRSAPSSRGCTRHRSAKRLLPHTMAVARYRVCPSRCCSTRLISLRTRTSSSASRWFRTASHYRKSITQPSTHI